MKRFLILIFSIGIILLGISSCAKDELYAPDQPQNWPSDTDGFPVSFSLSVSDIDFETGYEPMRTPRSGVVNKTYLTSKYRVIISKSIGNGDWVIDTMFLNNFTSLSKMMLTADSEFEDIQVVLRPGDYKITIITGENSTTWDTTNVIGTKFHETDVPLAYKYKREGSNSYPTHTHLFLAEDIFTGTKDFMIEKRTDLHSAPKFQKINVPLERVVGRVRVLLQNDTTGVELKFLQKHPQQVFGFVTFPENSTDVFANGVDVWGRVKYVESEPIKQVSYASTSLGYPFEYNGKDYYIGNHNGRVTGICYFVEPGKILEPILTIESSTAQQGYPSFYYPYEDITVKIENNKLSGVVFSPGEKSYKDGYFLMNVVKDGENPMDAGKMFNPYHEYNQ